MWVVRRWSGRTVDDDWRIVLATPDEGKARARYDALARDLRQGAVELLDPQGQRAGYLMAYRNRTRW